MITCDIVCHDWSGQQILTANMSLPAVPRVGDLFEYRFPRGEQPIQHVVRSVLWQDNGIDETSGLVEYVPRLCLYLP